MVGFPYLETFKVWLGGVLRNLNSLNISLLIAGALDQLSFKDCFQSRLSYDSAHLLLAASFKLPLQTRKCSPPCSCHKASTLSKENCSTSFHEKKKKNRKYKNQSSLNCLVGFFKLLRNLSVGFLFLLAPSSVIQIWSLKGRLPSHKLCWHSNLHASSRSSPHIVALKCTNKEINGTEEMCL